MRKRLVMAGCLDTAEGPWQRTAGWESAVSISGLRDGDSITVETMPANGNWNFYNTGTFPLPSLSSSVRYRVVKITDTGDTPTTVEVTDG